MKETKDVKDTADNHDKFVHINNRNIPISSPETLQKMLEDLLATQPQVHSLEEWPDPYDFDDMSKAIEIIDDTVKKNKKIKFIIDSDMDGIGCYRSWWSFLEVWFYKNVELLITDRNKGYGFIPEYIDDDTALYITSDNGITSVEATIEAQKRGAKVIICDHHQVDTTAGLPPAEAIINPYAPSGKNFKYPDISGTFVLWFLIKALSDKYIDKDIYDPYKDLMPELAITTISDVMPIDRHLNRFIVKEFIDDINSKNYKNVLGPTHHRQYVQTFIENMYDKTANARSFAFGLIPMMNATQRITKADDGATYTIIKDKENSYRWYNYLNEINTTRKERQQVLTQYIQKEYKQFLKGNIIVVPGFFKKEYKTVLGIISGKFANDLKRPAIVMSYNPQTGLYSGSGRSVGDFDILNFMKQPEIAKYIHTIGGHKQALGISVEKENIQNFIDIVYELSKDLPPEKFTAKLNVFGSIEFNKLSLDFFEVQEKFEPYGHRFNTPLFFTKCYIKKSRIFGKVKNHMEYTFTDKNGLMTVNGLKFFNTDVLNPGTPVELVFSIVRDDQSKSGFKLMIEYIDIVEEDVE